MMIRLMVIGVLVISSAAFGQQLDEQIAGELSSLLHTYQTLHAKPELSQLEAQTASFLAKELRGLGYEVTERVGRYEQKGLTCYGLVALMKNGSGPTVLVRTDLDALPVEEKTGLPFASKVRMTNPDGQESSVMHACGHDLHMTCFLGTARMLGRLKDKWQGTLILIGQPAEELGNGAKAMLSDGLYRRFPKPDYALALHTNATLEAGKIGLCEGAALANVSSVDITIRGVGGHGAYPHTTKDPIVIASEVVMALQTIVSREVSPLDPAVVTVGSIHGGTKHNIIPDEVKLQLTVRSYKDDVHRHLLSSIKRITTNVAMAGGVPADRLPIIEVDDDSYTPATYNNPELTRRLEAAFLTVLGKGTVVRMDPVMGAEDFGRFSLEDRSVPICLFWLGSVDPSKVEKSKKEGIPLPSLHSSGFFPLAEPAIRTGVKAMTTAVLELMKKD